MHEKKKGKLQCVERNLRQCLKFCWWSSGKADVNCILPINRAHLVIYFIRIYFIMVCLHKWICNVIFLLLCQSFHTRLFFMSKLLSLKLLGGLICCCVLIHVKKKTFMFICIIPIIPKFPLRCSVVLMRALSGGVQMFLWNRCHVFIEWRRIIKLHLLGKSGQSWNPLNVNLIMRQQIQGLGSSIFPIYFAWLYQYWINSIQCLFFITQYRTKPDIPF